MAKLLKLRRGTTSQHNSFTGAEGEVTIDTTKDTAVVHDGAQAGGRPLAREDMSNVSSSSIAGRLGADAIATTKIAGGTLPSDVKITDSNVSGNLTIVSADIVDGSIVNADVNASAAIAGTKISPDFGSQTISTTGDVNIGGHVALSKELNLMGTEGHKYLDINLGANTFNIRGTSGGDTNHVTMMSIQRNGATTVRHAGSTKLATQSGGVAVTGNISVSGTVDGRDVAADGTKLDGIESGATADQSASEILTAIKTVDGASSGLDADLLDGMHASQDASTSTIVARNSSGYVFANYFNTTPNDVSSGVTKVCVETGNDGYIRHGDAGSIRTFINVENGATADQTKSDIDGLNINADQVDGLHASSFIRSDTADTASGDITFGGGAGAATIGGGSDIRFTNGSWTGESTKIQHHNNDLYIQFNNETRFRNLSGGDICLIDSSGNVTASANVTAYSDARLKTDISTINDALGIVGKLRGVSYKWLKDGSAGIGVIAQEVEKVIPEVVLTNVTTDPATETEVEVKSVDYGKIVGVLINAINELKAEVDELKGGK